MRNRAGERGATTAPAPDPGAVQSSPELRLVSVLFVDLVGYTSLSEGRDAEEVRDLLGRYFESTRTIIGRYAGTVEKFIGDAVMAVWGVPIAREDDAERAVRAGLEILDAVTAFGAEVGVPDLRARAGVVTGQVAALANPGEGLVVGDRVNTASRAQSAAEPGTLAVDDVTHEVTSAAIAYEDAGDHAVKGKSEPIHLWRATRVIAGLGGAERERGIEAPLVGRDADLRLLKELFHGALERRAARLVTVYGAAGVGKTRLLWEFDKYVDGLAGNILWHSGRCLSYGDGVAYWALAEMIRQRLGIPEEAPVVTALEGRAHRALVVSLDADSSRNGDDNVCLASVLVDPQQPNPLALLEGIEQSSYVRDALLELPERLRDVVVSYFLDGEASSSIAARLGVTESRVSQMRSEALAMLRTAMSSVYDDECTEPGIRDRAFAEQVARRSSFQSRISLVRPAVA